MQGTTFADRFRVIRQVGEGAMAIVYLAEDAHTGAEVALKVLNPQHQSLGPSVERFKREGRLICRLHHPNLVQGVDSGTFEGRHYIAMEYIDGVSLRDLVRKRGHLPPEEAAKITLDVTLALNHFFIQGVIQAHRDIKPGNILITKSGTAKLTDFGIAKAFSEQELEERAAETTADAILGSLNYMSPEQIENPTIADVRSDIYALGSVFYEMLTGEKAFPGKNPHDMIMAHYSLTAPSVRGQGAVVDRCNDILARTLTRDIRDRFQTPSELAEYLVPLVGSDVVVSIPKFSRQSVFLATSVSAITIVAAVLIGVFVQQASTRIPDAPAQSVTPAAQESPRSTTSSVSIDAPESITGKATPKKGRGKNASASGGGGAAAGPSNQQILGGD